MIEDYNEYKEIVEDHLLDLMPRISSMSETLYDSIKYSLTAGGKRLRPVLLLASCEFAGSDCHGVVPYACAMEYIHTYSLIHDDLPAMDDDDMRRGKPSNHMIYGQGVATLAGDGLLNSAFEIMYRDLFLYFDKKEELVKRINAAYIIAKGAGVKGMVAGQAADLEAEDRQCSPEMLNYIQLNKTGMLIAASVKAGLYLGGADDKMMNDMMNYAENIGLAFQIADDLLDVKGDADEMGKATHADKKNSKATYVSVNCIEAAETKLRELTQNAVKAIEDYYDNAAFFRELALSFASRRK